MGLKKENKSSSPISVADSAANSPQTGRLTGFGYGIPKAAFTPPSVSFGNQNLGTTSATRSVTLSNPGTDTLKITSISLGAANPGDFKQTNTCPAALAPAAVCSFTVSFAPTAAGSRTASLIVTGNLNNIAGSTQAATLTGTGTTLSVTLSPATLTFASTAVGSTTATQVVTVKNTGTSAVTLTSETITGSNASSFIKSATTCTTSQAAGASCTVSVEFKPAATGALTASLSVADNATGSPQTVTLTGTGH